MGQVITQVDAFADRAFSGNPAAVCILDRPADEEWMQAVAIELNLSETAYLHPEASGYRLRWFTPGGEVDLCGHATLASAHVLWEEGVLEPTTQATFLTRSGTLTARRNGDWIELDFPSDPLEMGEAPPGSEPALGSSILSWGVGLYAVAEVESEAVVRALEPSLHEVGRLHPVGIAVTARASTQGFDFVSRFFAPNMGIPEDPVTGSAHCALGPLWAERLGKTELVAYQASARGGVVRVRLEGDRVLLSGRAVSVLKGELVGPASPTF